jgi:beta-barrel assembly-enhancing protease
MKSVDSEEEVQSVIRQETDSFVTTGLVRPEIHPCLKSAKRMHEETSFSGGVFSDSIEGGRSGVTIELVHDGIRAHTKSGQHFFLRYSECRVDIGGFNDRTVFCRNADRSITIFSDDKKFPKALSDASGYSLDDQLHQKKQNVRSNARRGRLIAFSTLIAAILLLVGVYYGVRAAGAAAVQNIPVSIDVQIGRHAFKSMDPGGKEVTDPVLTGAMQHMVDRLSPHVSISGMEFEVHVVDSPEINAFALPGGIIVVYTGLIQKAEHPEQVAGVLGHEMAHATLRHGLHRICQSLGLAAAANLLLGDFQGIVVLGSEMFQLASINSYSREQESAADAEGVRMLHAAAIDPTGLAQFFEVLKAEGKGLPDGLEWISTHPEHDARIISVRSQVSTLPPIEYKPLELDWAEVRKHADAL